MLQINLHQLYFGLRITLGQNHICDQNINKIVFSGCVVLATGTAAALSRVTEARVSSFDLRSILGPCVLMNHGALLGRKHVGVFGAKY